ALSVDDSHVAVLPDHSILQLIALAVSKRPRRRHEQRPILGMNQIVEFRERDASFLRKQTEDTVRFIGPHADAGLDITLPVADMRQTLRLFQSALALAQSAHDQEARQRISEPPADLLEELLLERRPDPGIGALAETEHVWLIALGIQRNGHAGSDAEALG